MSNTVATVQSIIGSVMVVSADGVQRQVFEGERLMRGDQVLTAPGGEVVLQLANGDSFTLNENSNWSPEPETGGWMTDSSDNAELEQALAAGFDPTTDLDATAAGPGAGGAGATGGGGRNIVMLDETAMRLDPEIGYPTLGIGSSTDLEITDVALENPSLNNPPVIEQAIIQIRLSESGFEQGIEDGNATHLLKAGGKFDFYDIDRDPLTVDLVKPTAPLYVTEGNQVTWLNSVTDADGLVTLKGQAEVNGEIKDVITITIDQQGNFEVTLHESLQHPEKGKQGADDLLNINVGITVSDGKATTSATIQIGIEDDMPEIATDENKTPELVVTEADFGTDAEGNFAGVFDVKFGADGEAVEDALVYSLSTEGPSGLIDSKTGQEVELSLNADGKIIGTVVEEGKTVTVLEISIDSKNGDITFDQQRPVKHSETDKTGADDTVALNPENVKITASATDGDGDTVTETVEIGGSFVIQDHGPSVNADQTKAPVLTADESKFDVDPTGDFSTIFDIDFGGDGKASTGHTLFELSTNDTGASGLIDTESGESVILEVSADGTTITGTAAGKTVLVITLDPTSGEVNFDQQRPVKHADGSKIGEDDPVQLTADAVQISATVKDADNDTAKTGPINIGESFVILDDGPTVEVTVTGADLDKLTVFDGKTIGDKVSKASAEFAGAFKAEANYGGDGAAKADELTWKYSLGLTENTNSGLTSGGKDIILSMDGKKVVGKVDGSDDPIFEISVNKDGKVTIKQHAPIDHPTGSHDETISMVEELVTLTGTATVKDGDGDKAVADNTINIGDKFIFTDHGPDFGKPQNSSVSESDLTNSSKYDPTKAEEHKAALTTTGKLNVKLSADGYEGGNKVTFDEDISAPKGLTSDGEQLVYVLSPDGYTLVAYKGEGPDAEKVFTVKITDPTNADAGYEFELHKPLDHTPGENKLPLDFKVVVTDADGDTATTDFTVTVKDDRPAKKIAEEMDEDSKDGVTFNTSADSSPNSTEIYQGGNKLEGQENNDGSVSYTTDHGTVTVNPDGSVSYQPAPNYSGKEKFEIRTPDGDTTTATMTVNPIADAPTLGGNKILATEEDTAISLGLKLPVITDDGEGEGNNPISERLGEITLKLSGAGANKVNTGVKGPDNKPVQTDGAVFRTGEGEDAITLTPVKGVVTIVIVGEDGLPTALHHNAVPEQGPGVYYLTEAQYEALEAVPGEHRHENFKVEVSATSYEVDKKGNQLTDKDGELLDGASSSQTIDVRVQAVTDDAELRFEQLTEEVIAGLENKYASSNEINKAYDKAIEIKFDSSDNSGEENARLDIADVTLNEDTSFDLTDILQAQFEDLDGSELRDIKIENTTGVDIVVNGQIIKPGESLTIEANKGLAGQTGGIDSFPKISIGGVKDFAGDLNGIEITINAQDKDSDGYGDGTKPTKGDGIAEADESNNKVTVNLHVRPVADAVDEIRVKPANGLEDQGAFGNGEPIELSIAVSSEDPNETHNIRIADIPVGSELTYKYLDDKGDEQTITFTADTIVQGAEGFGVYEHDGNHYFKVQIDNFNPESLSITPPHNSNADMSLKITGQTVDTVVINGEPVTNVTDWNTSPEASLHVEIKGVADEASVTMLGSEDEPIELIEDGKGENAITLDKLVSPEAVMHDTDGSESLSLVITGLPKGFEVTGDNVLFKGGSDGSREWVISVDNPADMSAILSSITITTPSHFSGKLPGSIAAVTTEDDGNSKTSDPKNFNAFVKPVVDGSLADKETTINEDAPQKLDFGSLQNGGDDNESLDAIFIKVADTVAGDVLLTYGENDSFDSADGVRKVSIDSNGNVTEGPNGEYYELTGSAINNIYAQNNTSNWAHNNGGQADLDIKYQVSDYIDGEKKGEATYEPVVEIKDATHSVIVKPITDEVSLDNFDKVSQNNHDLISVDFTITKSEDLDGSESLTQIILTDMPEGLLVTGVTIGGTTFTPSFVGGGKWVVFIPEDKGVFDANINQDGKLSGELHFQPTSALKNSDGVPYKPTVEFVTLDKGADEPKSASGNLELQIDANGSGDGRDLTVEVKVQQNDFVAIEDEGFKLSVAVDVSLEVQERADSNSNYQLIEDGSESVNFSVTVKQPAEHEGSDAILYQLNPGETEPKFDENGIANGTVVGNSTGGYWVVSGDGSQAGLDALLDSLYIQPPKDFNNNFNQGGMQFEIGVTTYLPENGKSSEATTGEDSLLPVKPVTDGAQGDITFEAVDGGKAVEGTDIAIKISLDKGVDHSLDIVGDIYLKIDSALAGKLTIDGQEVQQTVNPEGLDAGTYYKINQADLKNLVFTNASHQPGSIKVDAFVQTREPGADDTVWTPISGSTETARVNDGINKLKVEATGDEGGKIVLDITALEEGKEILVDSDGSETIVAVRLENVPDGFLVFIGDKQATNAGTDGNGSNTWLIQSDDLSKISIQPPAYWSGTVDDIKLSLMTKDEGLSAEWSDSQSFELVVNPVADGFQVFDPKQSYNDKDGFINLNLNATMKDRVDASTDVATDANLETATLEFSGLGENALILLKGATAADLSNMEHSNGVLTGYTMTVNGKAYEVTVVDGKYTISGLSQEDLSNIQIVQSPDQMYGSAGKTTIEVKAWTADGTSESAEVNKKITVVQRPAAPKEGADIIIGNDKDNTLTGADTANIIYSGAGDNTINAGNGDNIVYVTGNGKNIVTSGSGDDSIFVKGDGNNSINAGGGANIIEIAGSGANNIDVAAGTNTIAVSGGTTDLVNGEDAVAQLIGAGKLKIEGTTINMDATKDAEIKLQGDGYTLTAGNGTNEITVSGESNIIVAGNGIDTIRLEGNNSTVNNLADGDAVIVNATGNNTLNLASGNVTINAGGVEFSATGPGQISVNANANGGYDLTSVSGAIIQTDSFSISGGSSVQLNVAGNNATITALADNAEFTAGSAIYSLSEGVIASLVGVTVSFTTPAGASSITLDGEELSFTGAATVEATNDGFKVATQGNASVEAYGSSFELTGATEASFSRDAEGKVTVTTTSGNDVIAVTGDNNILDTGARSDDITVTGEGNQVQAGEGNDTITISGTGNLIDAGEGDDLLIIGNATDSILTGGDGADTFKFTAAGGSNTITDFKKDQGDKLDFSELLVGADENNLDHYFGFEQQGDDLLVTVKNDDGDVVQQVKLEGVQYSSDGDFISSLLGHQDQSVID